MAVEEFKWKIEFSSDKDAKALESFVKSVDKDAKVSYELDSSGLVNSNNISVSFKGEIDKDNLPADLNPVIKDVVAQVMDRVSEVSVEQLDVKKARENVGKLFEDKMIETTESFALKGQKDAGMSAGYVASRESDQHTFLIKNSYKKVADLNREMTDKESIDPSYNISRQKKADEQRSSDLAMEYITAPLYQKALYDRAPVVELVLDKGGMEKDVGLSTLNVESSKDIHIRSKFFDNFETLAAYSGTKGDFTVVNNDKEGLEKISKVEGFEKVIVASLLMGEIDYHAANIGVVSKVDEAGKMHHTAVKIDHGKSDDFHHSANTMSRDFISLYSDCGYGNMPFDPKKFKESIDQMTKISDSEIRNTIEGRVENLSKQGFEFQSINGDKISPKEYIETHVERIANNRDVMKEFSVNLEMIGRSNLPEKDDIISVLNAIGAKTPAVVLATQGCTVDGKNPIEWAEERGMKIYADQSKASATKQEGTAIGLENSANSSKAGTMFAASGSSFDGSMNILESSMKELDVKDLKAFKGSMQVIDIDSSKASSKSSMQTMDLDEIDSMKRGSFASRETSHSSSAKTSFVEKEEARRSAPKQSGKVH